MLRPKMIAGKILAGLTAALMLAGCGKKAPDESRPEPPRTEELAVTFIDVGKGDCILIQLGGKNVVIDTGYSTTSNEVLGAFERSGVSSIDCLIITHYDKDHVGGAAAVVDKLGAREVYLPDCEGRSDVYKAFMDALDNRAITPTRVTEDVTLEIGEAELTIFASAVEYKQDGREWNDNDISLVTALTYREDSCLFAGDLEKEGIKSYLKLHEGQYDVLKMPHHGSRYKNLDKLLESVGPKIAVITDGTEEPADQETLDLLSGIGAETWRTSKSGTIRIMGTGRGEYRTETLDHAPGQ